MSMIFDLDKTAPYAAVTPKPISKSQIDPRDYPSVKCKHCGHFVFRNAVILKEIPGALVGQGVEPVKFPIQIFVCDNCGEILESDIKDFKLENELNELKKNTLI